MSSIYIFIIYVIARWCVTGGGKREYIMYNNDDSINNVPGGFAADDGEVEA